MLLRNFYQQKLQIPNHSRQNYTFMVGAVNSEANSGDLICSQKTWHLLLLQNKTGSYDISAGHKQFCRIEIAEALSGLLNPSVTKVQNIQEWYLHTEAPPLKYTYAWLNCRPRSDCLDGKILYVNAHRTLLWLLEY